MKRFHVHVSVKDLNQSVGFYTKLFGAPPSVTKSDYAKWMLEDPRLNFAISQRGREPGVNHLGFQVDTGEELVALRAQVAQADIAALDEPGAACCYAKSDKYWTEDPQGVAWETYHTLGSVPVYGENAQRPGSAKACVPQVKPAAACC